jgi:predicted ester cyclase
MFDLAGRNKDLMRRIYEDMWNQADPSIAAEIFAQPEGVERFVGQFLLSFPDLQHSVEAMIAEDDRVAVQFSAHGTHTGQWMYFAPTDKIIRYTGVTLARIAEGKIIEHHTGWDKMGLVDQIGGGNAARHGKAILLV